MSANHGNTPAAWTGVFIVLVGFVVSSLGLVFGWWIVFWIGIALWPIGAIVGYVMAKMGLGHEPARR